MARAHFTKQIIRKVSGAPADGSVQVYLAGTNTPLDQPIYSADTGSGTKSNPFTFTDGVVDFFLNNTARIKLVITPTGGVAQTFDHLDVLGPAAAFLPIAGKAADADKLDGKDSTEFLSGTSTNRGYARLYLTGSI